jgi:hypothetical protein
VCPFFCGTGVWTQGLYLEPLHQPFFLWCAFLRQYLMNYLPRLASNSDLFDLCLRNS